MYSDIEVSINVYRRIKIKLIHWELNYRVYIMVPRYVSRFVKYIIQIRLLFRFFHEMLFF